jgi:uncharacterized protein YfaS (alpha-2-macroglobulin family)
LVKLDKMPETFREGIKKFSKPLVFLFLITILFLIIGFYYLQKIPIKTPSFTESYRLVPEKISQSAIIKINLPPGIEKSYAQKNIKFEPEIKGTWVSEKNFLSKILHLALAKENNNILFFKPLQKLKLNRYYSVALNMPDGSVIKEEFLVVEDPQVIAVFPKEDSESPENTEITIVFNRPMVPLTTLEYLEAKAVPVEIYPQTEGRFKWISTNILQFVPKERLLRSTNYKVRIKPGFVSLDGLPVPPKEFQFQTRKLRYLKLTSGSILYNQPISIYFNQPVDLEKTKNEITLIDASIGKEIPFVVQYGEAKKKENFETQEPLSFRGLDEYFNALLSSISFIRGSIKKVNQENVDKSIIQVYPRNDQYGREKLWDFDKSYTLIIKKAYPLEGDIVLEEEIGTNVFVAGVIKEIKAESERSDYVSLDFFDPQGTLWLEFYEDIDLGRSIISGGKIKNISYGEKCKEGSKGCEKVPDKKKIYLTFQSQEVGLGEKLEINLEKVFNLDGFLLNSKPIKLELISYPKFQIFKTLPENNSENASLTELVICSNNPIFVPSEENYKNYFKANLDFEIKDWGTSWKVYEKYEDEVCEKGQFRTTIYYRLIPESDYVFNITLQDVFGQKGEIALNFRTEKMPSYLLDFYHFQKYYNVTTPQKTKLTFAAENMDYINVDICKLSAKDFLYNYLNLGQYWDSRFRGPEAVVNCKERIKDTIELPSKYWVKNFFSLDIKDYFPNPIGNYIITFYHPDYKTKRWDYSTDQERISQVYERTYLNVTNLAVAEKKISTESEIWKVTEPSLAEKIKGLKNLYWVIDSRTLKEIPKAKLDFYKWVNNSLVHTASAYTDNKGLAFIKLIPGLNGVIVSKNEDSTILFNESQLEWASTAYLAHKLYLYTDKPIYRPGQEVFIKGIYRIGYDGNYDIVKNKTLEVRVFNSKDQEIFNQTLKINDYGTFDTKLILDKNSPLGTYRICVKGYDCTYFELLEYVPAPFQVEIKTDKEEYISKDTINLDIEAKYYFGVPVEGGKVEYTIASQNYYFDRYQDGYFNFERDRYYYPPYDYGDKFIIRGETTLDSQGKARISQVLDIEKIFSEEERKSKIIVVDVTVRNTLGQSVSAQKSFILHNGEFYLGLSSDKYFIGKNEKLNLKVKSVDTQGKEISVSNIKLDIYRIQWISARRQDATGEYSYEWEKKKELVKSFNFTTDYKGNYNLVLQLDKEGEYEAEIKAKDRRGNMISNVYTFYVGGEGEVTVRYLEDTQLEIETRKKDLKVGEEGNIVIKSPYKRAKALISIERGEIFDYQIKEITTNLYNFAFKVKKEYSPNIYVSVLLFSQKPEVKFAQTEFYIDRKQYELDIEVKSNKKFYLPGEEVVLDITTKDWLGRRVPAEVSIAVVDLSVLALKGNPKKNPLIFFYDGFPLTVSSAANLKNILVTEEIKEAVNGKGGAGMVEEALAVKKRGIFKETAFWQAVVRTDSQGKAQVRFTLPDNLTTWQTETLGVTKDTKVGVSYIEFLTRKELMAVPFKPRFVVPGDEFFVGAQIFNQTKNVQRVKVKFESQTLILKESSSEKAIVIDPEKSATVYFKVQAPYSIKSGEHNFVISALGDKLQDIVEQTIKITPNNTYEVIASSNYTALPVFKEYVYLPENIEKDRGELTIKTSATLAVFLSDALNYLLQFPYGCSEQISSKLKGIAVVKRALNVPNLIEKFKLEKIKYGDKEYSLDEVVQIGLQKLYNNQTLDGGFSWWGKGESDFHLTLYVVETLNLLSKAGFNINKNSLERALNYLYKGITTNQALNQDPNTIILTAYTLLNSPSFANNEVLKEKIRQIVNDDLLLKEKLSNTSLAYLAIVTTKGSDKNLEKKVFDILDNRVDIDSRGAFLETGKNFLWEYYETPIKNTALYLKAKVARKENDPILEKVLRWILNSKYKDGSWGSTQNTALVIDALTDYLEWKKETNSNFTLEILVNDKKEGQFTFNPQTILEQFLKEMPVKNLKFNSNNVITFKKENHNQTTNAYYYDLALRYYLKADKISPRDEGFSIKRGFYKLEDKENKNPIKNVKVGEILRTNIQVIVPKTRNFVMIEDFIPAGMEIVNLDLATEQKSLRLQEKDLKGRELIPDFKEMRDDRLFLYVERLKPGVYEFEYFVRPLIKGKFIHLPAQVLEMYFPENFGRTSGDYFEIE